MADKKNKSKTKDPYLERNEFKKDFYNQLDKPPTTDDTIYGTSRKKVIEKEAFRFENLDEPQKMEPMPYYPDKEIKMEKMPYITDTDPSTLTSGRSPEEYRKFKEVPFERRDYKNGGDIHIEKGHSYIKDLIK